MSSLVSNNKMKLVTFKNESGTRIGAVLDEWVVDLNKALGNSYDMLTLLDEGEKGLDKAREAVANAKKEVEKGKTSGIEKLDDVKLLAPIPRTRKNIVCLGLNYAEHVAEGITGSSLPPNPIYFTKPPTSITGPYDPVVYNKAIKRLDYEVELAFVIGKQGKYIPKEKVHENIAGYMVFQDISARQLQTQHRQWYRGKSQDTFAPMGPYLVTADEVGDPSNLNIWCKVNGELRQNANTRDLIFNIETIVSTLSDGMTMEVGDVFATGTPSGVGASHSSGLLKVGDVIESGIEGLGVMRNEVISEK